MMLSDSMSFELGSCMTEFLPVGRPNTRLIEHKAIGSNSRSVLPAHYSGYTDLDFELACMTASSGYFQVLQLANMTCLRQLRTWNVCMSDELCCHLQAALAAALPTLSRCFCICPHCALTFAVQGW